MGIKVKKVFNDLRDTYIIDIIITYFNPDKKTVVKIDILKL